MAVVGREVELAVVEEFLAEVTARSLTLAVEGEAGIGKSTVFDAGLAMATSAGFRVLLARPAAAEARATWSGLADLLDGVSYESLPDPQRRALDAALVLAEPVPPVQPRATWVALRSVVTTLAQDGPVLLAIDDAHWLDNDSAAALTFLIRRLPATDAGILFTTRRPNLPADRRLALGPLPSAAVDLLVREHLGVALPRISLERIHAVAAGNPLFALEMARHRDVDASLPRLPDSLHQLVADRIERLPAAGRTTLVAIAAAARPSVDLLAATGLDGGLSSAEAAGLVRVTGFEVTLTHPLLGAAAYHGASSDIRRAVHASLASGTDAEEAARHRALAARAPDAAVADAAEAAARRAARRGAPAAAAELADLAIRLTPDGSAARWRRNLLAGEQLFLSGAAEAAAATLRRTRDEATDPDLRADAAYLLADLSFETDVGSRPLDLANDAVALAGADPHRRARAAITRAYALYGSSLTAAAEAAHAAVAMLDHEGDTEPALLAGALVAAATLDFECGRGLDRDRFHRAAMLEARSVPPRVAKRANAALAPLLKYADDFPAARTTLAEVRRQAEEEGDESALPYAIGHLPQLELWAGRWDAAEAAAREQLVAAQRIQAPRLLIDAELGLAQVAAWRGDASEANRLGHLLIAGTDGDQWDEMAGHTVLGVTACFGGDYPRAVRHLDRATALAELLGLTDPGRTRCRAEHVEALIAVGEHTRAAALLDEWAGHADRLDRVSARAAAARCRALLAAATGDHAAAVAAVDEALAEYDRVDLPFDRARTLLLAGRLHRRAKHKRAARDALTAARDVFVELGARQFLEQTDHDLTRIGLRTPAPTGVAGLTATEHRVVELAADGRTTKEIAGQLFLSTKTVEANLTRIYRKLHLRSRADLANWHHDRLR